MNRFKKGISLLLVAVMILPLGTFAFGEETDILGHWAKEEIQYLIGKEVVSGYSDGNFRPDQSITRAEFFKVINNVFGYSKKGKVQFTDVKDGDWFYDEVAKAVAAGYAGGYDDGTMKPNNPITRQEVSKIMGMVFDLDETKSKSANNFADSSKIGDWAKGYVSILKDKGYISGYSDKTFRPTNPITRAEAVKIITNASGNIINLAGEYSDDAAGNVLVNTSDVELKDMEIKGDLYLVEGIGEGDVILDNVVVEGNTYIRGGGENSIIIRHSKLGEIVINKDAGDIRVVLEGETIIEYIAIESGTKLVVKEGVKVDSIKVTEKSNIEIEKGAEIGKVEVEARDTEIKAKGKIESIVSKEDVKVNDEVVGKGKEVKVEDGKVTEVKKDKPKPEPASSAGGGGGGGGGGGRRDDKDDEVAVTGVSVSPKTMTLTVGKTGKITATVKPDNATNKKVNWTTSDESIATVANGVVTAKAAGTATITATSDANSSKKDSCVVTVKAEEELVSAISVEPKELMLKVDETGQITATVSPSNASNKRITWASDNEDVATVDENGEVKAIGQGKTKITATTVDGGYTASVDVIVADIFVMSDGGGDFETIQAAINAAEAGDTIFVDAGEYVEAIIIPEGKEGLKLLGAQAGNDGRGEKDSDGWYQGRRGVKETVIIDAPEFYPQSATGRPGSFEIGSEGVVVDGFTIKHYENYSSPPNYRSRERIWPMAENITIKNNVIERGIEPYTSQISGLKISNNWFTGLPVGNNAAAIQIFGAIDLEITDNMFTDPSQCNKAINLQGGSPQSYVNTTIARNQIGSSPWTGIEIQGVQTQYTDLVIEDNIIRGIGPGLYGIETAAIRIWGQTSSGNAVIRNNKIYDSAIGLILSKDMSNVTIEDNYFENNEIHVLDKDASSLDLEKVLEENTFPEGSQVIGNEIKVFVPEENKVYNKNTGEEYDTIQAAINDANNEDVILVGSGTYEENLVIDKLLVLNGAGRDVTTIKGNISIRTSNVTIEGFTIEGEVVGPSVELLSDIFEKNEFAQESIIVQLQDGTAKITSPSNAKVVNTARNRGYEDFKTAVDAAEPGDTIKLMSDIQLETKIDIAGKTLTLDLNNHKLSTVDVVGDETNKSVFAPSVLNITQNADVTIEGPGTIQSGKTTNSSKSSSNPTIKASKIENLTIQNCTIIGGEAVNSRYAGDAIEFNSAGTLTLNNVTAAGGDNVKDPNAPKGNYTNQGNAGSAIKRALTENATVNITGSTLKGGDGLNNGYDPNTGLESLANGGAAITNNYASTFNITDSYVKGGNSALYNAGNAITANYGTFTIENCTVEGGDAQTEKAGNGRGIGGDGISVGTSTMTIVSSTITGGDGGDSQLGCGIKYNNTDGILNISDSIISGGGVTGSGTGFGNAIYAGTTESYESFSITLADTLLKLGVDDPARVYGGSVLYKSGTFDLTDMLNAIVGEGLYEILEDGSVRISNPNSPFSINKFSYTVAEEELDLTPLEDAIEAAKAAKEGAAVSEEGLDVPAGAYWVTQEDMDALDEAIARAEAAKETAETQEDVDNAVAELEAAIAAFNEAKREAQEAIDEEELEGAEDPANEQEVEDDEEIVDEQVDTEENTDNGLEGEGEAVDEEDAA